MTSWASPWPVNYFKYQIICPIKVKDITQYLSSSPNPPPNCGIGSSFQARTRPKPDARMWAWFGPDNPVCLQIIRVMRPIPSLLDLEMTFTMNNGQKERNYSTFAHSARSKSEKSDCFGPQPEPENPTQFLLLPPVWCEWASITHMYSPTSFISLVNFQCRIVPLAIVTQMHTH